MCHQWATAPSAALRRLSVCEVWPKEAFEEHARGQLQMDMLGTEDSMYHSKPSLLKCKHISCNRTEIRRPLRHGSLGLSIYEYHPHIESMSCM